MVFWHYCLFADGQLLLYKLFDIVVAQKDNSIYQECMSVKCISPSTPLLFGKKKTGVCRGSPNFLIFDPKHTLRVLVRTGAYEAVVTYTYNVS